MPMDFPDLDSLKDAATVHGFRQPNPDESADAYRVELAEHVAPIDFVEPEEIRNGVGWDKFTTAQNVAMLTRKTEGRSR